MSSRDASGDRIDAQSSMRAKGPRVTSSASLSSAEFDEGALLEAEIAAALLVNSAGSREEMPTALAERIVGVGQEMVRPPSIALTAPAFSPVPRRSSRLVLWSGWMAAAATLLFWLNVSRPISNGARNASARGTTVAAQESPWRADSSATRLTWTATADPSAQGASGSVVWSRTTQAGEMRLAGLRPNDRARWQYQLWIFDKRRDQRYPVDGGVFDIPPGVGEVRVPIRARLPVGDAIMFVVTVEPAGGVVVSSRERVALTAKPRG